MWGSPTFRHVREMISSSQHDSLNNNSGETEGQDSAALRVPGWLSWLRI